MPEYLAPGVYVEETSFRSKSIEGVSTTTTGFVGPCRYGPVTEPADVITSLGEFERSYAGGAKLEYAEPGGQPDVLEPMDNYLWHGVRAFFNEGGKRLYIARVFRPLTGDYPPDFDQPGVPAAPGSPLYADGHGRASFGGAEFRSRFPGKASNLIVQVTVNAGSNILGSVRLPEDDPFDSIPDQYEPKLGSVKEGDVVLITRGTSPPTSGDLRVASYDPIKQEWRFRSGNSDLSLKDLALFLNPAPGLGDSIYVLTASVTVLSDDRKHDLGTWVGLSLNPELDQLGGRESIFDRFRAQPASISEARSLPLVLGPASANTTALTILAQVFPTLTDVTTEDEAKFGKEATVARKLAKGVLKEFALTGGNDGFRPGANEYEGTEDERLTFKTGLKQFRDVEDISIIAAPGSTADYDNFRNDANAIFGHLISHAEFMRYCIAVLDCPPNQGIADVRNVRSKLDSKYAAFYYPWVTVLDPVTRRELDLPPSGFVAGIYARNDINRAVYKAPANEVVNLAIGFEQSLNKGQQEVLNPEGINCFRFFEGRGFRLWGARTISSDPEWKYVNLRRYFAYLERSIDKGTQWAVFEPNGYALWANVRRTIEDFLLNEFQMGALLGEKPEQAYFVKCDRSTMTQNDLDNGRLIALIGVAALRPAEFVIFRIGQWTADRKS
jgi:Bacteriophage tail sheath protein